MVGKIFLNIFSLYKWNGQLYGAVSPPQLRGLGEKLR